ncbi:MAG: hypothetical protein A2V70_13830 [Planctomycetes bacterium RBG_13_63_9]|nr:MAG: hypothetical protein A2V70_13830 [Planctomycetes bacterium RBG_13_63_9]
MTRTNHRVTSPADRAYNCIAWAVKRMNRWWWPDRMEQCYWPEGVQRAETLQAFVEAYGTKGFTPCDDPNVEAGYQKIALYAKEGVPTHAARQLSDGRWTSKLGTCEDIDHMTLEALEGGRYGRVAIILRRWGTS